VQRTIAPSVLSACAYKPTALDPSAFGAWSCLPLSGVRSYIVDVTASRCGFCCCWYDIIVAMRSLLCITQHYIRAFSALTLLVGRQEGHPACKNWVVECWRGYLSGTRCRLAYGPADATATTVQRSAAFYAILNNMCLCVFMYFMLCILLRCKWPIGPFAFNKLIESVRFCIVYSIFLFLSL